ncbi:MAG: DapH/DapD/GlmU-related protein [Pseudomonadota bacterium]
MLRGLLGRFRPCSLAQPKSLAEKYPQHEIGRGTYGSPGILSWNEGAALRIGAFCSIADGVQIFLGGEHRLDWVSTYPFSVLWEKGKQISGHPDTKGDVIIGNDVWIGREAVILSGVTIGDGAVIGARAVITKDVPPYAIVAGNPARLIRKRFSDEVIQQLLALKWWAWPDEEIGRMLPSILSADVEAFLAKAAEVSKKTTITGGCQAFSPPLE